MREMADTGANENGHGRGARSRVDVPAEPDGWGRAMGMTAPLRGHGYAEGTAAECARIIVSHGLLDRPGLSDMIRIMAARRSESMPLALRAVAASGSVAGGYAVASLGAHPTADAPFIRWDRPGPVLSMLRDVDAASNDDSLSAAEVLSIMVARPLSEGWDMSAMLPEDGPWSWHVEPGAARRWHADGADDGEDTDDRPGGDHDHAPYRGGYADGVQGADDAYLARTFADAGAASTHPVSSDYVYRRMIALSRTPAEDMRIMGFEHAALLIHLLDFTPESILGYDTKGGLYHAAMRCAGQGADRLEAFLHTLSGAVFNWKGSEGMVTAEDLERMAGLPYDYIRETVAAEWGTGKRERMAGHGRLMDEAITGLTASMLGRNRPHDMAGRSAGSGGDADRGKPADNADGANRTDDESLPRDQVFVEMFGFPVKTLPRMMAKGYMDEPLERMMTRQHVLTAERTARRLLSLPEGMWTLMEHGHGSTAGFIMDHPLECNYARPEDSISVTDTEAAGEQMAKRALLWADEIAGYGADAAYRWMVWTRVQNEIGFLLYDCDGISRLGLDGSDADTSLSAVPVSQVRMWVRDGTAPDHLIIPLRVAASRNGPLRNPRPYRHSRWVAVGFDDPRFGVLTPHRLSRFIPDNLQARADIAGLLEDLPRTWAGFQALIGDGETAGDAYRRIMLRHVLPISMGVPARPES